MERHKHLAVATGIVLVLSLLLSACAPAAPAGPAGAPAPPAGQPAQPPAPAAKKNIKIGFTISSTGFASFASLQGLRAMELWAEEVNKKGGIPVKELGTNLPVELVYYDDRSDKEVTAKLYEKLILQDNADILVSNFGSALTLAAAPITEKNKKLLMIWAGGVSTLYEQGLKYIVSGSQISTRDVPRTTIAFFNEGLGVKTLALVFGDAAPWPDNAKNARDEAEKRGMKVVLYEQYPSGITKDFSVILEKIRSLKPDGIKVVSYLDDQITFVKQMKELDVNVPAASVGYAVLEDWWKILGKDGVYFIGEGSWIPELEHRVQTGFVNKELIDKHKALFPNEHVTFETAQAYVNVLVLEEMIKKAGSLDADKLRKTASELSGKLVTLLGPFVIDDTGRQLGAPFLPMQRVPDPATGKSKLIILWPKEIAAGKAVYPMPTWREKR